MSTAVASRPRVRPGAVVVGLVVLLALLALASACIGQVPTSPAEVLGSIAHRVGLDIGPMPSHPSGEVTLWQVRFPRVILAILVGAALGCSGALLQGVFSNPLAESAVVGARDLAQLTGVLSAEDLRLPPAIAAALDDVSA